MRGKYQDNLENMQWRVSREERGRAHPAQARARNANPLKRRTLGARPSRRFKSFFEKNYGGQRVLARARALCAALAADRAR